MSTDALLTLFRPRDGRAAGSGRLTRGRRETPFVLSRENIGFRKLIQNDIHPDDKAHLLLSESSSPKYCLTPNFVSVIIYQMSTISGGLLMIDDDKTKDNLVTRAPSSFETSVRNLNSSLLAAADAGTSLPRAAAVEVATAIHGADVLRAKNLDNVEQRPITRIIDALRNRKRDNGPTR